MKNETDIYLTNLSKTNDENKTNSSSKKRSMDELNNENINVNENYNSNENIKNNDNENKNENKNKNENENDDDELLNVNTFLHDHSSSPKKSKGNNYKDGNLSLNSIQGFIGDKDSRNDDVAMTVTDSNHSMTMETYGDDITNQRYSPSLQCITTSSSSSSSSSVSLLLSSTSTAPSYTVSDAEPVRTSDLIELQYQLSAVVRHIGVTAFTGHYICDTLAPPSSSSSSSSTSSSSGSPSLLTSTTASTPSLAQSILSSLQSEHEQNGSSDCNDAIPVIWNRTNDSLVHRIPESTVLSDMESPYIFFYTKI